MQRGPNGAQRCSNDVAGSQYRIIRMRFIHTLCTCSGITNTPSDVLRPTPHNRDAGLLEARAPSTHRNTTTLRIHHRILEAISRPSGGGPSKLHLRMCIFTTATAVYRLQLHRRVIGFLGGRRCVRRPSFVHRLEVEVESRA